MESMQKEELKNIEKTEIAPRSLKLFIVSAVVEVGIGYTFTQTHTFRPLIIMLLVGACTCVLYALCNERWLREYKIELSLDAVGLEEDEELFLEYESDYRKDRFVSYRLLDVQGIERAKDKTGCIIYAVGRYRSDLYARELEEHIEELEQELKETKEALEHSNMIATDYSEELHNLQEDNIEARKKLSRLTQEAEELKAQLTKAIRERDRAVTEFERELVGYAVTEELQREQEVDRLTAEYRKMEKDTDGFMAISRADYIEEGLKRFDREEGRSLTLVKDSGDTGTAKLTEREVQAIVYKLRSGGFTQMEIAEEYGIAQSRVSQIKKKYVDEVQDKQKKRA